MCTRQSRKVLWVVLSVLLFKEIWKKGTEATDICLRVHKESNKSRFDSYSRYEQGELIISHITFRECRVYTFFFDNLSRNGCRSDKNLNFSLFFLLKKEKFNLFSWFHHYGDNMISGDHHPADIQICHLYGRVFCAYNVVISCSHWPNVWPSFAENQILFRINVVN